MTILSRVALASIVVVVVVVVGCSSDPADDDGGSGPLVLEEGCQPLLADTVSDEVSRGRCVLPYPSDFFLKDGHVVLPAAAKPRRFNGSIADIHEIVPADGFSLIPTIVATLPSRVSRDGLPGVLGDPMASATAASLTIIIDADTGAFVPHYTDKIDRGLDDKHEPIVLRTFSPLAPKKRYVVAIKGVHIAGPEGAALPELAPPPRGFGRLRDRKSDPVIDGVRERFERSVFEPLAKAGIRREDLQLAWDFTTGSEEEPRRDMLKVRELVLAWLDANPQGPTIAIAESKNGTDRIWKTITGSIKDVPLFLDQPGPGARLFRGSDGQVAQNGTTTFDFTINVPISVRDSAEPGRALAYGHGFFGGRAELEGNGAKTIADRLHAVEFGIDWWGMAKEDVGRVSNTLGETPEHGADFVERVHQAMANWIVMTAAIKGPLAKAPELARAIGAACVYDPSFVSYFGASQGHILGGTVGALDPDFSRIVLNVGGGGFTHMMPRSANFGPFSVVLDFTFKDELVTQAFIAMFQRALDRVDPITYAPLITKAPLDRSPADRKILLQVGLGDAQVPNAGSFLHARSLGIKQTMPAPSAKGGRIFGLDAQADPSESAITVFDFHIDTSGYAKASPLEQNGVHEGVRVNAGALVEMDAFLRPNGTIAHPCNGECDPD